MLPAPAIGSLRLSSCFLEACCFNASVVFGWWFEDGAPGTARWHGSKPGPALIFFIPYYFLAVVSLCTHVGCAGYWLLGERSPRLGRMALCGMVAIGCIAGVAINLSLAGQLQPVTVPATYLKVYGRPMR